MDLKNRILAAGLAFGLLGIAGCTPKQEAKPQIIEETCIVKGVNPGYSTSGSCLVLQYTNEENSNSSRIVRTSYTNDPAMIELIVNAENLLRNNVIQKNKEHLLIGRVGDNIEYISGCAQNGDEYKIDLSFRVQESFK